MDILLNPDSCVEFFRMIGVLFSTAVQVLGTPYNLKLQPSDPQEAVYEQDQ